MGKRRISLGLLEETEKLAKKIGTIAACKQAGMSRSTLQQYIVSKTGGFKGSKTGLARKTECLRLATNLKKMKFSTSMRKCWIEAGNRLGINGRTVEHQYIRGLFVP